MPHETELVATLAAAIGLAFAFGFLAVRLRLPALIGYLVAGVVVGPITPGLLVNAELARQLAEVGVILLMFGVGLNFSIQDLLAVRRIAVPGALLRIVIVTAIGAALGRAWAWTWGASFVFGLSLSIASTIVVLRVLEGRGTTTTLEGRVAVGWLVVEDLATVFVLVLMPALTDALRAGPGQGSAAASAALGALALTLLKIGAFIALMLYVGTRLIPRMLAAVARTGSREIFTLSVLALALGIAFGAAALFGVSFALGAFFAGVVIAESDLSHQAAADALPLQDAFAVLFFVAVGMVFDPGVVLRHPVALLATLLVVTVGKALVSSVILGRLRLPLASALDVAAGLSQIGEFSLILSSLAVSLGVLPQTGQNLILASAMLSITLNPLLFRAVGPVERRLRAHARLTRWLDRPRRGEEPIMDGTGPAADSHLRDHAVIVGFGRVGGVIGRALESRGIPYIVVEKNREWFEHLRGQGLPVLFGDAARRQVLEHTQLHRARLLVIAAPGAYQARAILDVARRLNPAIDTVVRTHSEVDQADLEQRGVGEAVMGERELALGMARYALRAWDTDSADVEAVLEELRAQRAP
jgi:K+:H+ antiporter